MKLLLRGHNDRYAVEQLQLALFPEETMEPVDAPFSGDGAVSALHIGPQWITATAKITLHGKTVRAGRRMKRADADVPSRRRLLQNAYYAAAMLLREPPEWGSLSGVRPTKLTTRYLLAGGTETGAQRLLEETYHVTPARSRLAVECSLATVEAAKRLRPQDVSVYIGIPFCPTRCAYCSFVSQTTGRQGALLEPYLAALEKEIAHTGALLRASGKTVRTLYIGGGTPTTLSTEQLCRLMETIAAHFDLSSLIEYTVEGGRPDTLDILKLCAIFQNDCERVSINPQTMNDTVLRRIGRCHTAKQTRIAYMEADAAGLSINMDLIAGLPDDTPEGFHDTLEQILALDPDSITVHALTLKRAANLFAEGEQQVHNPVEQMVRESMRRLPEHGYAPYYMYRQKNTIDNQENVGYARAGKESLYNILIMDESQSIFGAGCGASTKLVEPCGRITRIHNYKFPYEYIRQFDQLMQKKEQVREICERIREQEAEK